MLYGAVISPAVIQGDALTGTGCTETDCCAHGVNFLRLFFAKVRGVQGAVYVLREASACNPVRTSAWVLARMFFKSRLLRGTYRVSAAAALCSFMYSVLR